MAVNRQRRPLGRRQIGPDVAGKDHGVALRDLTQDEADLFVQHVSGPRRLHTALH
jgi:hypothetical protein